MEAPSFSVSSSNTAGTSLGVDPDTAQEYAALSKQFLEFVNLPTFDKAWIFNSLDANTSRAMLSVSQPDMFSNKYRTMILSGHILKDGNGSVEFHWSPFPVEMTEVATVVPSPSGEKLLVVRNKKEEEGLPSKLEIWNSCRLEKEISVPPSVHGTVYAEGWFEGISWNQDESLIAYVAEEPPQGKPTFNHLGFKYESSSEKDAGIWKGQGDWEENWGETYWQKRKPALFVVNINSGEVRAAEGIPKALSVGQVVWAPSSPNGSESSLVFVGWTSENGPNATPRKLGIKYCTNRPCALYAIYSPFNERKPDDVSNKNKVDACPKAILLTHNLSSAFFPRFSRDGKVLMFLSAKSAVDSGAHTATESLHRIDWPADGNLHYSMAVVDVVPIVMCPGDDYFPGLYDSNFLPDPWLSDGCMIVLSSVWCSTRVILSVNIFSGKVSCITPGDSSFSWHVLALDGDNILAAYSSPVNPSQLKYGCLTCQSDQPATWNWLHISTPTSKYSDKVMSLLSTIKFDILKIPVKDASDNLSKGAREPFEAIFVWHTNSKSGKLSEESPKGDPSTPLIMYLHGGPHSVSYTSYSKSLAFLSSLGYNMLIVNYRGTPGFGEEALQSLPGKVGFQDVNDVLAALDYVTEKGLVNGSKVAVLGGSHGGFLSTHLIGQAPNRISAAAISNPVCNLSLMVGTTDIPDWCYIGACGTEGKNYFSEAPSIEQLVQFYNKSPISHLSKVKAPVLVLLGAQDLRVPNSNGLQYARALREKGVEEVKVILFPEDVHALPRPLSNFESYLNIGVWFKKHCF